MNLIGTFRRIISNGLWGLVTSVVGVALLLIGISFVSYTWGQQDDPGVMLVVSTLLSVGVIFILISVRIRASKPVSFKDGAAMVTPPIISIAALLLYGLYHYYQPVIWMYIMYVYAFGVIYLIFSTFLSFTEQGKEIKQQVPEVGGIPPLEEKWRPIFTGLGNIGKEASEIEKNISNIYRIHRQLRDRQSKTLRDVADIYIFSTMLDGVPKEYVEPFKAKLWELLESRGIEEWLPEVGKPPPDGCKKMPASKEYPVPPGTVAEVLSPGLVTKEDGKFEIIEKPLVIVSSQNAEQPKE